MKTLLKLETQEEYKQHFVEKYCNRKIYTFSNIRVKFYKDQFEHAFFASANRKERDKSIFSIERAERMDWIEDVLLDKQAEIYIGWDRDKKEYNNKTRRNLQPK